MQALRTFPIAIALLVSAGSFGASCESSHVDPVEFLGVEDSRFTYEAVGRDGSNVLSVLGTLRNTSEGCVIDSISLEARFMDESGKEIDIATESLYGVSLWPSKTSGFRLQSAPALPKAKYASVSVRPVSARIDRYTELNAGPERREYRELSWYERYRSLLVMGLAFFVAGWLIWLVLARSGSPMSELLKRMDEQNAILLRYADAMERQLAPRLDEAKGKKGGSDDS